ncbi:hypothetical protein BN140_0914 [Methanoculleus bourgensis MS2]|uniref:Uncharacterized protein n=1 Tax=Methanoculleus bourgensis (strain ATCC 43281 / DSM 3045 / OCM 15 / MS2) TaxID=1201294 RepID=I7LJC3_METBM|nr:hypothetical protein BN140_0914 [Methanoculleus bourgensis MS2]
MLAISGDEPYPVPLRDLPMEWIVGISLLGGRGRCMRIPGDANSRAVRNTIDLLRQYFAKTVEVIFKRVNHRPPFAFSRVS